MPKQQTDTREQSREILLSEINFIVARYDSGAMPPGVFAVVAKLKRDLAKLEHGSSVSSIDRESSNGGGGCI